MTELNAIIKGCVNGDRKLQEEFYREFYPRLIAVAYRLAPDSDTALDLLQDSYIKIFDNIYKLDSDNPAIVFSWCKRILKNTIIDYYRKNKMICVDCLEETVKDIENDEDELTYLESKGVTPNQINDAIQKLSPQYKLVFEMYVMDGLTHREISKKLEINEGTSKSNYSKARQNIKRELEKIC